MKNNRLIILFIFFLVTSCDFGADSGETSGGGLFTGTKALSNKFSINIPSSQTFLEDSHIDIILTHAHSVTVSGIPRLVLTIGSTTRYANYLSGSTTKNLTFRYTVQASDEDLDGIELSPTIDLNNGAITFAINGSTTNANTSFSSVNTSGLIVGEETPLPTVSISSAPNILANNVSNYTMSGACSAEGETVTITISGTTFTPICSSSVWSTGIIDLSAISDSDTITIYADHNDAEGNSAVQASVTRVKDTNIPTVLSNTITGSTYTTDDSLTIDVIFNQPVIVSGTPQIQLNLDTSVANPIYLTYTSGTTTDTLSFTYTVVNGDEDSDGVSINSLISLNSGSIVDINGNEASLNLVTTNFPSALIFTNNPEVTSLIEPVNATYAENGVLLFQINFDNAINVTGSPRLVLDIGGTTRYANYTSGTGTSGLEFSYTIQAGESDNDGIEIIGSIIDLNSGSITSAANGISSSINFAAFKDSTTGVLVDTSSGISPPDQVSSVATAPTTSNTTLGVSWPVPNNNGTSIINYSLQYREKGQSTWINKSPSPTSNSTTVTGLTEGVTYEFRVAANNGFLGPFSPVSEAEIFDVMSLNPIAWLDATNINGDGTSPSDGTKIDNWVDLTGAATNAEELTPANQPTIIYNTQNGLPSVRFDNHAVGLQGTFTRSVGEDLTFIIVGQFDSAYSDKCLFEFKGPGNQRGFFIDRRYASNTNYSPSLTKGSMQLWRIEDNGSTATVTENTSSVLFNGTTLFGTDFIGTGNYVLGDDITGGNRMYGYISEFLIFDKALSSAEILAIETYLQNKWGTP